MAKVHEVVAARDELKKAAEKEKTRLYHLLQKEELFNGFAQRFEPSVEDADVSTPEEKPVQYRVEDVLAELFGGLRDYWDTHATTERSNISTRADIVIEEETGPVVIMKDAPIGFLLFLDKQLDDMITALRKTPVLKSDVVFHPPTDQQSLFHGDAKKRAKTGMRKKSFSVSKDSKTGVETFQNLDVQEIVGYYYRTELSGAISESRRKEITDRMHKVQVAANKAKERANDVEASQVKVADRLFGYVLRGKVPAQE